MAKTIVDASQVTKINSDNIDITTTGKALVTKLIPGSNIAFSSTGVDEGTGEVTINVTDINITNLGAESVSNKAVDFSVVNDILYPSVQATKNYVDNSVVGLFDLRGNYDASVNAWPSTGGSGTSGAILKGDFWKISVAGSLGGNAIQVDDSIYALADNPGQTSSNWATINSNITYTPVNKAGDIMTGNLTAPTLSVATSYTPTGSEPTGRFFWDTTNHTAAVVLENGVVLQLGQENHIYGKNASGVLISNGDAVSLTNVGGSFTTFAKTDATNSTSANSFVGVATQDISINAFGFITVFGEVHDLDTHLFTEGLNVYVNPFVPGKLTQTPPSAPNFTIDVGKVEYSHNSNGKILVNPTVYPTLTSLSDVDGTPLSTSGQILVWDATRKVWDANFNIKNYEPLISNPISTGKVLTSDTLGNRSWIDVPSTYTLPTASTTVLGGVKVDGTTISINSGVISSVIEKDTTAQTGILKGNGSTITSATPQVDYIAPTFQSVPTSGGTTPLTATSPYYTIFTGTQNHTVVLPNATTMSLGRKILIDNDSTQSIDVKYSAQGTGNLLWTLAPNTDLYLTCSSILTADGTWEKDYAASKAVSGKSLTINNLLTLSGTDGTIFTFPSTSGTILTSTGGSLTGQLSATINNLGTSLTDGILLQNTTAAANGAPQNSPAIELIGQGFETTGNTSQSTGWKIYNSPYQASSSSSLLTIASSVNNGAYASKLTLSNGGTMNLYGSYVASSSPTITPTDALVVQNNSAATSGTTVRISSSIRWSGYAWNTTATASSKNNSIESYLLPISGATTSGALVFQNRTVDGNASTTELMRLTTDGKLGIGVTPTVALDVLGAINVTGGYTYSGTTLITSSGNDRILRAPAAGGLTFRVNSATDAITILSSGYVGIGTITPTSLLQVTQPTTGTGTITVTSGSASATGTSTQFTNTFKVGDTFVLNSVTYTILSVQSDTALTLNANSGATFTGAYTLTGGDRFVVKGNGYIGIGTTNPLYTLDLSSTGVINTKSIQLVNGYGCYWGDLNTKIIGSASAKTIDFQTSTTSRMYIVDAGNVGIGLTSFGTGLVKGLGIADGTQTSVAVAGTQIASTSTGLNILTSTATNTGGSPSTGAATITLGNNSVINAANGTVNNIFDVQLATASKFKVSYQGSLTYQGSITRKLSSLTSDTTLDATYHIVLVSNNTNITLPTAVGVQGREYVIKKTDFANTVTILTTSNQNIEFSTSWQLTSQGESITTISDGNNWYII